MSSSTVITPAYLAESTKNTVHVVCWIAASFATVFVSLRLYVRIVMKKVVGADDAVLCIALILLVAYAAVCSVAANYGLGRHLEFVAQNPNDLIQVALLADIGESLAIMACTLGKTSIAITLLRIVVKRWMIYLLWFVIITMNLVNILAAIFVFVQCKDPRHLWDQTIPSECWDPSVFTNFSLFVGAYSGAQDFVLALLPWIIIWNLQMKKKEKFAIAIAMSLGVFAGVTAIVKTTYLVALSKKSDFTFALAPLLWWAAAEDGLAMVAASIPILRPLLQKLYPSSTAEGETTSRTRHSYPLKSVTNSNNMFTPDGKGNTNTIIEARPGDSFLVGDDESDKSILDKERHKNDIKRTTRVGVTYS